MNDLTAFLQSIALDDYKAIRRLQVANLTKRDRGYDHNLCGLTRYSPISGPRGGLVFPRAFVPTRYEGDYEVGDQKQQTIGALAALSRSYLLAGNDHRVAEAIDGIFDNLLLIAHGPIPTDSPIEIDHSVDASYCDSTGAMICSFQTNQILFRVQIVVAFSQVAISDGHQFPITVVR